MTGSKNTPTTTSKMGIADWVLNRIDDVQQWTTQARR